MTHSNAMTRRERVAERLLKAWRPGVSGDVFRSLHPDAQAVWLRIADEAIKMADAASASAPRALEP